MRKYYRAALFSVAVVSIISLLVYRHEYNKLRYVLEVLNYFGKHDQKEPIDNYTKSDAKPEKLSSNFDEPFASWQRLSDDLFVYSSYSKNNKQVVTIGFGKLRNNFHLNCNVHLDKDSSVVPGKFSFTIMKNTTDIMLNDEYCGYLFKCEYTEGKNPIGVSYHLMTDDVNIDSPILSIKHLTTQSLNVNSYAFCVAPLEDRILTLSEMKNFLVTHKILGVDDFIVYDYSIPDIYSKDMKSTTKYSYTKIPWNFPFSKVDSHIIREIIEFDCLHRTYNKVMYTAVLSWNEKVSLHYHSSLQNLMVDFKKGKMYGHRYMLKTSISCVKNRDDHFELNTTITRKPEGNWKNHAVYISKPDDVLVNEYIKTMEVLPDLVYIKRNQVCNDVQENVKQKFPNFRKSFRFAGDA